MVLPACRKKRWWSWHVGGFALLALWVVAASAAPPCRAILTVYGAAGRVSGSLAVLDTGNGRWMIDCGACYPEEDDARADREERAANETAALPVEPDAIDALLVTHAHLDHLGRVPLLVDRGFRGPIYLTDATAELAVPMLDLQVRFDRARQRMWSWSKFSRQEAQARGRSLVVHWRRCPYRQQIAEANLETAEGSAAALSEQLAAEKPPVRMFLCPRCAKDEVTTIADRFRRLRYGSTTAIGPGVAVTLLDAGHMPGSASILFEIALTRGKRRIMFSGDLGNDLSALLDGPKPAPESDAVVLEATYGVTRRDAVVSNQRAAFRQAVAGAVSAGGIVWIPAFALDRTQRILYELHLAQREGLLPEPIPIYVPSPTAAAVTDVYRRHQRDGWFRNEVAADPLAWQPSEIRKTVPSRLPRPSILISPSDMTTAAWSERLLERLIAEPSTSVFLVGYQDPFGEGGRLRGGATSLLIRGQQVPVRAQVRAFQCFSGHADAAGIDRWLAAVPQPSRIILVHGGAEELKTRAEQLGAQGRNVTVAVPRAPIDLGRDN